MIKKFNRRALSASIAMAVIQAAPISAVAEELESFSLEEIVVTAQKREQSLQDVPSSVNAIQGDALTDMKLFNFSDIEQVTPGLDLRNINGRAGSIALRGVDFNPNSAASAAVDVYWNDVTLGSNASGGVFQEMFDVGRVELLRGPQGTLQGRTSPAGAVAIHTAQPDLEEIEGYIRTTVTDNSGTNTQFASSLPIIPGELSVRVAGVYSESDLNELENLVDGDVSDVQTKGGRFTVLWEPSDTFSAQLVYQYLENDLSTFDNLVGSPTLAGQGLPSLDASNFSGIQTQPLGLAGRFENTSLKLDWEIADHQVTFLSGYSDVGSVNTVDNSSGNAQVGFTQAGPFPFLGVTGSKIDDPQSFVDENVATSQELRIASLDNEFWDYTVGIYYGDETGSVNRLQGQEIPLGGPFAGLSIFADVDIASPFDVQSYGVFSHNILYLTEQLTAQAGIRWQRQERTVAADVLMLSDITAVNPTLPPGSVTATLLTGEQQYDNSEKVTGSVSLQYAFTEYDASAYISAGTSFRPGGPTISAQALNELALYNEEDSWSIEVGVKSTWLDNRLRLNGAVFYQDYSDYIGRANRVTLANGRASAITTNGDATVQGVEVDFEYLMTQNWRVAGGMTYVEAEYKDGVSTPGNCSSVPAGQTAALCDVSGLELGSQAPFTASVSSDYTIPMDEFEVYVQGLYKFTGRRTDVDAPSGDLGGYGTFDVHLGLREASAVWDVSLFARNLFDKNAVEAVQPGFRTFGRHANAPGGVATTGFQKVDSIAPRLIGVSATYNF